MKIKRVGTYITGFKYYKYRTDKANNGDAGIEITDEDTINKIKKLSKE